MLVSMWWSLYFWFRCFRDIHLQREKYRIFSASSFKEQSASACHSASSTCQEQRVTEECCFILQDIEMIAMGESQRHNYIHPETLFLMEMRALRPIDFVIRIARLEYVVFSSVIFPEYPFEHCNQPAGWEGSQRSSWACRLLLMPLVLSWAHKPNTDSWPYFFHGTSIMSQMFPFSLPRFTKCHSTCMHTPTNATYKYSEHVRMHSTHIIKHTAGTVSETKQKQTTYMMHTCTHTHSKTCTLMDTNAAHKAALVVSSQQPS